MAWNYLVDGMVGAAPGSAPESLAARPATRPRITASRE